MSHTHAALMALMIGTILNASPVFANAVGQTIFYGARQQQKSFPKDPTGKCGLKNFILQDFDTGTVNVSHPGKTRMTSTIAIIETTDPSCVLNYGMVQYIRGCVYQINYYPKTKKFEHDFAETIDSRGLESVPFVHRDWSVDSLDLDPLYQSVANASTLVERMGKQYRLNGKQDLLRSSDLASLKKDYNIANDSRLRSSIRTADLSKQTMTFTTDTPTTGNYDPTYEYNPFGTYASVTNTSLEFKTCVYAMDDIPTDRDPKGFNVPASEGGPIVCFDWNHKNTFNFTTKEFDKNKYDGIDPYCAEAPVDAKNQDKFGNPVPPVKN